MGSVEGSSSLSKNAERKELNLDRLDKSILHYKILEKLGEGGMGVVFKAHDTKLDRFVALKFLPPHLTKSQTEEERFIQEAKAASAINHPNVCTIYDLQEHDEQQFIIMEFVDGETLSEKIKNGNVDKKVAIDYAIQIADALKTAHEKGIIHRDIKSENIMITSSGQVKVMDFGLAKLKGSLKLTKTSSTVGTLAYMSPEQIHGEEIDARSDIFSFGVVLYEMLSGHLPFQGEYDSAMMYSILNNEPEPIQKYYPESPSELIHILDRSLEKESEERYQTINDILIELKRVKKQTTGIKKSGFPKEIQEQKVSKTLEIRKNILIGVLVSLTIIVFLIFIIIERLSTDEKPDWLGLNSQQKQFTSEAGEEFGSISPDGKRLVYVQNKKKLYVKNLDTKEINEINFEKESIYGIDWSPDGLNIALVADFPNNQLKLLVMSQYGNINYQEDIIGESLIPTWSPDGKCIAICNNQWNPIEATIKIINLDTNRSIQYPVDGWCKTASWSPNSRYIAFIQQSSYGSKFGTIKLLDLETETIIQLVKEPHVAFSWLFSGLSWSPDNRYLVYVGYKNNKYELFTLHLNSEGNEAIEEPITITNFQGNGSPFWPYFSNDSKLNYTIRHSNQDIYMMSIDYKKNFIISESEPIAISTAIDRPHCWLPDENAIVFSSIREDQWDIFKFDLTTKKTEKLTSTHGEEKNVKICPDKKSISFYQDSSIWSIPINERRRAIRLTPDSLKLAECYTWSANDTITYATIEDSTNNSLTLTELNLKTGVYFEMINGLNPFNADVAVSPNGKMLVVAGVMIPNNTDKENILRIDLHSGLKTILTQESFLSPQGKISWTPDSKYILNDQDIDGNLSYELIPVDGSSPIIMKLDNKIEGTYLLYPIDPLGKKVLMRRFNSQANIWIRGDFNN